MNRIIFAPPVFVALLCLPARAEPAAAPSAAAPSVMDGGAACDGVTDDAAPINRYLGTFSQGGLVRIPAGRRCLIASADLVVPPDVILRGDGSAMGAMDRRSPASSGLLLDPARTVALRGGASLRDLSVTRAGLLPDPTDAQAIGAVAAWGREESTAITLEGGGVRLEHLFIEGFNTAIYGYSYGDFIFSDIVGDDYNGIVIVAAGDNTAILDARFEPFYSIDSPHTRAGETAKTSAAQRAAGGALQFAPDDVREVQAGDYASILEGPNAGRIPYGTTVSSVDHEAGAVTLAAATAAAVGKGQPVAFGGAWGRPGVSFYLQGAGGNTTGWYCVRCFSFEYRYGMILDSVGVGYVQAGGFEWQQSFDPGTDGAGTVGVRLVGISAGVSVDDTYSGGRAIEFSDEGATSSVVMHNLGIGDPDILAFGGRNGPSAVAGLFLEGGGGTQIAETIGGELAAGDAVTLTVDGVTIAYTAKRRDTKLTVALALARRINADQILAARQIAAYVRNGQGATSVVLYAPAATGFTHKGEAAGRLSLSEDALSGSLGAWGELTGYTSSAPDSVPSILVGPDSRLPFRITGFPLSNTGGLAGAISIDPTSVAMIQLQNLPAASGPGLSGCGNGPSLSANATDARGVVTEGASASGCTVSFRTKWPVSPVCTVASPNGAPLSGYAASRTALSIANPLSRGGQYAWQCVP